ncbi:MAG: alpha/beta hydrolase [Pseudomonadota bacterium]
MRAEPKLREGPIATDRLTLYALRSTPKRPEGRVLLLGGSNFDLRLKRQFLTTNLAARFEILTYEPRGIGRTEQPEGAWDMADYAADAAALMDAVGWDQADIVGESFGGMTALHLGHHFPDRVARVAVISATAGGRGGGSAEIAHLLDLPRQEAAEGALKLLDTENIELSRANPKAFQARVAERMAFDAMFTEPSIESGGYHRLLNARARHDIWDALPGIRHETLVITGARDAQAPPEAQKAMAQALPNQRQWVYDAGHGLAFAMPEPMRDLCAAWSAQVEREVGT